MDQLTEDEDVVLLDAEVDDTKIQVNYYLLIMPFVLFAIVQMFGRLSNWIAEFFFLPGDTEKQKIKEALEIKKQMNSLSVVDDFASYSKLQRKLNHLTLDSEADALSRKSLRSGLAKSIRIGLYILLGLTYFFTVLQYARTVPVVILPYDWFAPFGSILAFPTGVPGAVSLPIWTLLVRTVSTYFKRTKDKAA